MSSVFDYPNGSRWPVESRHCSQTQISRPTVQLWRQRFLALRLSGLEKDAPRPGRIPRISLRKITAAIHRPCTQLQPTQRIGSRSMAKTQVSARPPLTELEGTNLKPHLIETLKLSRDKRSIEKLHDVVGPYLNPPDKALVLCVDERSQTQASIALNSVTLKTRNPSAANPRLQTQRNHHSVCSLHMLDSKVIGDCMPRHRHQEFIRFLQRNCSDTCRSGFTLDRRQLWHPQASPRPSWLKRHPRFRLHFIPTSSSWLNMAER